MPSTTRPPRWILAATGAALLGVPMRAASADPAPPAAPNDHCANKPAPGAQVVRTEATYDLPDVTLKDQAGRPFRVTTLAQSDRPVVVNFIFATCTTICPVMTATFAQLRQQLGADADRVKFVSLSIDPEHDTPEVLAAYAEKFDAPADWSFLTGPPADVERALRGFDAWFGSKLNHQPITLIHAPGQPGWVRLTGLGGAAPLRDELTSLLASGHP